MKTIGTSLSSPSLTAEIAIDRRTIRILWVTQASIAMRCTRTR